MKGKIRFLFLLLMFLVFLPTNIFAEDKILETKDISSESVSLDEVQVSKDEQSAIKESERKDLDKKDLEQEIVEESEVLLTEEVEEADTEDLEKQETIIEDDSQDNGSELEISEVENPEAVKTSGGGGSSGGGSGSFSSGGGSSGGSGSGYVSASNSFLIQKINEKGNPMKVAFKITNLGTGESHIVITNENGISQDIIPSQFKVKDFIIIKADTTEDALRDHHFETHDINNKPHDRYPKKPDLFPEKKAKIDVNMPDVNIEGPKVDVDIPDVNIEGPKVDIEGPKVDIEGPDVDIKVPAPNKNDKFLNDDKFYKYADLEKYTYVKFSDIEPTKPAKKGTVKVRIDYGYGKKEGRGNWYYGNYHEVVAKFLPANLSDELIYENITKDQVDNLDKETLEKKIKEYARQRFSRFYAINKMDPLGSDVYAYKYSVEFTNDSNEYDESYIDRCNTYKFEELRTDTNVNYSLKTFYVKIKNEKSEDGKITRQLYMGDTLDNITKEPDFYLMPTPLPPVGPVPPVGPNVPTPGPKVYSQGSDGLEISNANVPVPVGGGSSGGGGGGSSVGGSGSGKGVPLGTPVFKIVNEKFNFKTFASDANNKDKKVLEQGGKTQVTDKISFGKLSEGKEYKFVGKLINKRTGEEVKTEKPIVYETGKLTSTNGEATITITFDSSKYEDGDEFVLIYDIFEDGKLAGFEKDLNNKAQSFKIVATTPPPEEETPPPEEETPPPKEETPPSEEETPPVEKEVEKENPKEELVAVSEKTVTPTPDYIAPKTYDPGIGLNVFTAILSGAAFTFLRKRR